MREARPWVVGVALGFLAGCGGDDGAAVAPAPVPKANPAPVRGPDGRELKPTSKATLDVKPRG